MKTAIIYVRNAAGAFVPTALPVEHVSALDDFFSAQAAFDEPEAQSDRAFLEEAKRHFNTAWHKLNVMGLAHLALDAA